jgi:hypothetical protein
VPELTTIEGVPLVTTGTYDLQSGETTFTEEDLLAAVRALEDPAVHPPRVKINGLAASFDPEAHGGEPALGRVENMRVSADGQTLLGDFLVPPWLADAMSWAYPARSIEGAQAWRSPTGNVHDLVVSAVALLGVDPPGVATLPDLQDLLTDGATVEPEPVLARMPARTRPIAAGLDQDLIRRRFFEWIEAGEAELPEGSTPWDLWVRSLRFDDDNRPYLKVESDATGTLFRVDFTVEGSEVAFDGFQEVVEQDVSVAAAGRPRPPLAVWPSREESRSVVATGPEEADVPIDLDALRQRLGLPADATEEQINAALAETPEPEGEPGGEPEGGGEGDGGEQEGDGEGEPQGAQPQPVAARAALPEGVVAIDEQELQRLRAGAQTAEQLAADRAREDRDRILAQALTEGRFPRSRRDHWAQAWDRDPEGTRTLLTASEADGGLARGLIPVEARGVEPTDEAGGTPDAEHEAYMHSHFPQVMARRGRGRVRQRQEV